MWKDLCHKGTKMFFSVLPWGHPSSCGRPGHLANRYLSSMDIVIAKSYHVKMNETQFPDLWWLTAEWWRHTAVLYSCPTFKKLPFFAFGVEILKRHTWENLALKVISTSSQQTFVDCPPCFKSHVSSVSLYVRDISDISLQIYILHSWVSFYITSNHWSALYLALDILRSFIHAKKNELTYVHFINQVQIPTFIGLEKNFVLYKGNSQIVIKCSLESSWKSSNWVIDYQGKFLTWFTCFLKITSDEYLYHL